MDDEHNILAVNELSITTMDGIIMRDPTRTTDMATYHSKVYASTCN
jgi:hypothetical protein